MPNWQYCSISDPVGMAAHIAYPIFTMVENTAARMPVSTVAAMLPQLCSALYNNMLTYWLYNLQTTATFMMKAYGNMVNKEIVSQDIPLNVWDLTKDMFTGYNIQSLSGVANFVFAKTGLNVTLPEADTRYLADLGTKTAFPSGRQRIIAEKAGVLLYLLRYVGNFCANNDAVTALISGFSGGAEIPELIQNAIARIGAHPDEAICAIVELCCPQRYSMSELFSDAATGSVPVQTVAYSEYWTRVNADVVTADFDGFLNTALQSFTGKTVGELLCDGIGSSVFTNSLLNTAIIAVRDALSGMDMALDLLHVDISAWNDVTEDYNWGFTDGDKSGFTNAAVSALSPFNSLFRMLLTGDDVNIMNNNLTVLGYTGYADGIVPILEALGCRESDIVTPAQYIADISADESAILRDILVPVLNLLERIYSEPVITALEILPNIIYFIETGMFELSLKNTLQSIFVLLDNVRPLADLGIHFDFSFEGIVELVSSALGSSGNGSFITELINKLDITSILQGDVITGTSRNGNMRKYISVTTSDSLTAILRAAVELIFSGDNEEAVELLVLRSVSADSSVRSLISAAFEGLDDMYNETDGTDKILSLIYYIYNMGDGLLTGDYSVIAELLNRWDYIVDTLESGENEYLVTFLGTVLEGLRGSTGRITDTQSTNIADAYYLSSTLALRGVTDGVSYADTLTKHAPSSFTDTYSLTHQAAGECTAVLYAEKLTDVADSGMSISASLGAYSGSGIKLAVSLLDAGNNNLTAGSDSVTVTSANGETLTYTLSESGTLPGSGQNFDTSLTAGENVGYMALRQLSGILPAVGDSVTVRVVLTSTVLGGDGSEYTNASYTDLTIYSVDKAELRGAAKAYTAPAAVYTDESYTAYSSALGSAKTVLSDKTAKQSDINTAAASLADSHGALIYSDAVTSAVRNAYELLPVTGANYTAVKAALASATEEFTRNNAAVSLCGGTVIEQYNEVKNAYSDYINTLGADSFTKSAVSYQERSPFVTDAARTASEKYMTNATTYDTLLGKIDEILASPDFASLTGMKNPLGDTVSALLENALCNDGIVTAAVRFLYPTVSGLITDAINSASAIEIFGETVNLSNLLNDIAKEMLASYSFALYPKDLADVLEDENASRYSANIRALRNTGDNWDAVSFDSFEWQVHDIDSLLAALGAALTGVKPVITALLTRTGYAHSDTVYSLLTLANLDLSLEASACGGYEKAVLPLLEILCDDSVSYTYNGITYSSLRTPAEFNALTDISDMLGHIVCPLLSTLETSLNTAPVAYITGILPDIASFFRFDLGSDLLNSLSTVVGFDVSVDVYGSLISQQTELSLGALLSQFADIDLSDLNGLLAKLGDSLGLTSPIPAINVPLVASLGELAQEPSLTPRGTRYTVEADGGAVLSRILSYAAGLLGNTGLVNALGDTFGFELSGNDMISAVLESLNKNTGSVLCALNELVVPFTGYGYKNVFTSSVPVSSVTYSHYWTQPNAKDVAGNIDGFINQITTLFGMEPVGKLLETALSDGLYTNRNLTSAKGTADEAVTVWLREGTYTFSETLEFTADDLPNVTYKAYGGEKVNISGASEISGFTESTVNGVKCFTKQLDTTSENWYFRSLFSADTEKDVRMTRYPESGSFEAKDVDATDNLFTEENTFWEVSLGNTSFNAYPGDIEVSIPDGGDAYVRVIHRWIDELSLVTEYEEDCGKVRMSRPATAVIEPGDVYWFENIFAALDNPGEFYLDSVTGILYYIPYEDECADTLTLYRPKTEYLLTVNGADNIRFENITFCNTEWSLTTPVDDGSLRARSNIDAYQGSTDSTAAINISNARGTQFLNCDFFNLGNCAVMFSPGSKDCKIEGCHMKNIGSTAVAIWGYNLPEGNPANISGIRIHNNHIEAYGRHTYESVGVHLTYAEDCQITHNEIHDGYYSGISCGWIWGHEYHVTKRINIDDNLIYDIGQGWLGDLGGIYMLGEQPGTTLRGNVIANVRCGTGKTSYGGNGIYTDAGSSYLLIENNLVYDCSSSGINIGGNNKENIVNNNISAFNAQSQFNPGKASDDAAFPCIATRNIFYACNAPVYIDISPGLFPESRNLMWDAKRGMCVFFNDGYYGSFEKAIRFNVASARINGYLADDVITDPLFVSAKDRDFTLCENSPALKLGFVPWDISAAGTIKGTALGTDNTPGGTTSCSILRDTSDYKVSGSKTLSIMTVFYMFITLFTRMFGC